MGRPKLKLVGQKIGRVLIISDTGQVDSRNHSLWKCLCDCGNECTLTAKNLRPGRGIPSCGCFVKSVGKNNPQYKHGFSCQYKAEYHAYLNAIRRCTKPEDKWYSEYGGRGIQFKFKSFEHFYEELGDRPTRQHSLDRINNDGNYESGNVRWATKQEQAFNRRKR